MSRVNWPGARNAMDLGGVRPGDGSVTADGRVFRSGAPEWMTEEGWSAARAAGVRTLVDLRNEREKRPRDGHPVVRDEARAGIVRLAAPTEDPDAPIFQAECGPWLDSPRAWGPNMRLFPHLIVHVLRCIADSPGPVLVHCSGGRDRSGMICCILLAVCGADPEALADHDAAAFRGAAEHAGHGMAFDTETGSWVDDHVEPRLQPRELDAALAARRAELLTWLEAVDLDRYLVDHGLSGTERHRLRSRLAPNGRR